MSENITLLALFKDVDPAADGIEKLHELGIHNDHINVISGIPIKAAILGRPTPKTNVPKIGMLGAILGMGLGIFLIQGVPLLYPLVVGGQPLFPIPQTLIITFEMTMLGLMGFSFIGMFIESRFPSFEPVDYVEGVSEGKIALFFVCPADDQKKATDALTRVGAEYVKPTEARKL